MAESDLDRVIEQYQLALGEFVKGNPEPLLKFHSQRDDLSIANPYGRIDVGPKAVEETARRVSGPLKDGKNEFENIVKVVTSEMAFFVWVERVRARIGDKETPHDLDLRVTVIFIPEDGTWKLVHRHADPITSAQPIESVIQN